MVQQATSCGTVVKADSVRGGKHQVYLVFLLRSLCKTDADAAIHGRSRLVGL